MFCVNIAFRRETGCKENCQVDQIQPFKTDGIDCDGNEEHLFYCENKGWGNYTDGECDTNKIVEVTCDLGT